MNKQFFLFASLCLALTACDTTHTPKADDTGRNVRDRSSEQVTPENQKENETDRRLTQKIRQGIMDNDSLSTNAKNVKILTINGVVTLRGPVNTEQEKNQIAQIAQSIQGVKNVNNQLEVINRQ